MDKDFSLEKKNFIETYNLARPIMTILGDQVRQEILLALIEVGDGRNYYYIDFDDTTVKPVILFWQQVEPMLKRCSKESEKRL